MAKQNGPAVKAKPFFTGYIKLTALSCSHFVSGIQWAYKFIVMLISECPIISCSVLGGIPLSMHLVTNVSRNAWTVNFSIPAASQILLISSFTMDDFRIFPRGLLNIVYYKKRSERLHHIYTREERHNKGRWDSCQFRQKFRKRICPFQ